jgi:hypothetical protein
MQLRPTPCCRLRSPSIVLLDMQLFLHADTSAALPLRCWHAAVPPRRRLCSPPSALLDMQLFLQAATAAALPSCCQCPPQLPSPCAAIAAPQGPAPPPCCHSVTLPPCWPPYCHTPCARPGIPSRHPYCCRTPCIASSDALLDTWATAASRTAAASVPPAQRRSSFNEHWLNCKLICCPNGTQQLLPHRVPQPPELQRHEYHPAPSGGVALHPLIGSTTCPAASQQQDVNVVPRATSWCTLQCCVQTAAACARISCQDRRSTCADIVSRPPQHVRGCCVKFVYMSASGLYQVRCNECADV